MLAADRILDFDSDVPLDNDLTVAVDHLQEFRFEQKSLN